MEHEIDEPLASPPQVPAVSDFALELLAELRASHFRPGGWARFLVRSWRQSRATARAHPALVRSWARVTLLLLAAEALVFAGSIWWNVRRTVWRALPSAVLLIAAQQFDVYVHLGMNNPAPGMPLWENLGRHNSVTLGRQAIAGLLWSRLIAGQTVSRRGSALALLAASASDVADGMLARRDRRVSRLGQYLDGSADLSFALALAFTLGRQRLVPRWLVALVLARWCLPVFYTLARYFGWITRVPIGSTPVGRAAGLAQALALGAALAPTPTDTHTLPWLLSARRLLHLATAALLVAAPLSQWHSLRRSRAQPRS